MKIKDSFKGMSNVKFPIIMAFLIVFIGTFVISAYAAYVNNYDHAMQEYFDTNNLGDIWLKGENFTEEDLETLKGIENINDAERFMRLTTRLYEHEDVKIETNFLETNKINKMEKYWGEEFTNEDHGIWINKEYAKKAKVLIGDTITIMYENHSLSEKVRGIVSTPDHVNFGGDMYVYLDKGECCMEGAPFQNVVIDVDDYSKVDETIAKISELFPNLEEITKKEDTESYGTVKAEINDKNNELEVVIIGTAVAAIVVLVILEVYVIVSFRKEFEKKLKKLKSTPEKKKEIIVIADIIIVSAFIIIIISNLLGSLYGGNVAIDKLNEKMIPEKFIKLTNITAHFSTLLIVAVTTMAVIVIIQLIETLIRKKK